MDFKQIEEKWQEKWEKKQVFKAKDDSSKEKFYFKFSFSGLEKKNQNQEYQINHYYKERNNLL